MTPRRPAGSGRSPGGVLAAGTAVASWGLGNVLARYIDLAGPSLSFDRLWFGAAYSLLLVALFRRRLSLRALRTALPGGIAFGLNGILFFSAVKLTSVTNATIIVALQPAILLTVVGRLFGERVRAPDLVATAMAVAGTVAVVAGGRGAGGDNLGGDALAVAAVILWAWYFVASKRAREVLGTVEYQAAITLVAAVIVTPVALAYGAALWSGWGTAGWVVVLALGPGGGHFLMNWAHGHTSLTVASLLTLAIPVVSMAGAAGLLGERVSLLQWCGAAVVIGSLAVVVLRRSGEAGPDVLPPPGPAPALDVG